VRVVFELIFKIFAADIIIRDLGFYLSEGVISKEAAKNTVSALPLLLKELAKHTPEIIESLNVPVHALHTPIIGDYVQYN
jgi:hypothetical protein